MTLSTTHHHEAERLPGPSGDGTVVLDVGASRGALVVYTPPSLEGIEVEIRARGEAWTGRHMAVRRRDTGGGACFAVVFDRLAPATYELRPRHTGGEPVVHATAEAARVTEAHWPSDPAPVGGPGRSATEGVGPSPSR